MRSVIRQAKTVEDAVNEALNILSIEKSAAKIEIIEEPKAGILGIFGAKDAVVKVSTEEDIVSDIINEVFHDDKKNEKKDIAEEKTVEKSQVIDINKNDTSQENFCENKSDSDDSRTLDETTGKNKDEVFEESYDIENLDSGLTIDDKELNDEESLVAPVLLKEILEGMKIDANIEYSVEDNDIKIKIMDTSQRDTSIVIGKRGDTLDAIQYILNLAENKKSKTYKRINLDISNYRDKRKKSLIRLAKNMSKKALSQNRNIRLEPMNAYERKIIHSALQDIEGVETFSEGRDPRRRLVIKVKN